MSEKRRCLLPGNPLLSSFNQGHKSFVSIDLDSSSEDNGNDMFLETRGKKLYVSSEEDDIDLGYKIFLEHLKEDGNSYVLEMPKGHNGEPICVRYEKDLSSDETEIPLKRRSDKHAPTKVKGGRLGKNQKLQRPILCSRRKKRSASNKLDEVIPCSFIPNLDDESKSLVDESYLMFLNHVRVHEESMVLELENGVKIVYEDKFEGDTASGTDKGVVVLKGKSDQRELQPCGNSESTRDEENKACNHEKRVESSMARHSSTRKNRRYKSGQKRQPSSMPRLTGHGKNRSSNKKAGEVIPSCLRLSLATESLTDSSYQTFLNHVVVHGDSLVLELENGDKVVYEEACTALERPSPKVLLESSSPEPESHTTLQQPSDFSESILACENDADSPRSLLSCNQLPFNRGLMACLSKPFDQEEHDQLLKDITAHKIMERRRDLRSRSISYETGRRSRSYLDFYPDLAGQIKNADPNKTLALLRGFFFWLKHLSHEGAYKPWKSPFDHDDVSISSDDTREVQIIMVDDAVKEEMFVEPIQVKMASCLIKEETDVQLLEF